jgi:mercuric ion binding protein
MNFTKSLITFSIVSSLFLSCKDTASKPISNSTETAIEKKITVATKPETATLKIEGMTCAMGCAKTIESKLSKMDGVQEAKVDFENKLATVNFDAAILNSDKIKKEVESAADGETYKVSEIKIKS